MSDVESDPLTELKQRFRSTGVLVVDVKVIPKSSTNEVYGLLDGGTVKVRVSAAPEKGKANRDVCRVLAEFFGVPERNVNIVSGESSPRKRVSVRAD